MFKIVYNLGSKILIATGIPRYDTIIEVENSTFRCNKFRKPFPVNLRGATGGLIKGQTPFICGGYDQTKKTASRDCYKLNEAGDWTKDQIAILNTARSGAGTGSAIINNKLVLSGGRDNSGLLKSIELVSPNESSKTLSVQLPLAISNHCSIKWDFETVMIIGGESRYRRAETYFINVRTNTLKNGPSLNNARTSFACEELKVEGKSYIVVSGGWGALSSTEVLDKDNIDQGWQKGTRTNIFPVRYEVSLNSYPFQDLTCRLTNALTKWFLLQIKSFFMSLATGEETSNSSALELSTLVSGQR